MHGLNDAAPARKLKFPAEKRNFAEKDFEGTEGREVNRHLDCLILYTQILKLVQ